MTSPVAGLMTSNVWPSSGVDLLAADEHLCVAQLGRLLVASHRHAASSPLNRGTLIVSRPRCADRKASSGIVSSRPMVGRLGVARDPVADVLGEQQDHARSGSRRRPPASGRAGRSARGWSAGGRSAAGSPRAAGKHARAAAGYDAGRQHVAAEAVRMDERVGQRLRRQRRDRQVDCARRRADPDRRRRPADGGARRRVATLLRAS